MSMLFRRVRAKGFTLIELLVVIAIIGILATILIPQVNNALIRSAMTKTSKAGRTVYEAVYAQALDSAVMGTSRADYPKNAAGARPGEISFQDSTEYLRYLVTNGALKVSFDFFGAKGVKPYVGTTPAEFMAENNAWCIAANLTDANVEETPFMFTRNLNITKLDDGVGEKTEFINRLTASMEPFGNRGFVLVTKGGSHKYLWGDSVQYQAFCATPTNNPVLRPGTGF